MQTRKRNLVVARLDDRRRKLAEKLAAALPSPTGQIDILVKDSLTIELEKLDSLAIDVLRAPLPDSIKQEYERDEWRIAEKLKLRDAMEFVGLHMSWFSIGYGVTNTTFRLFDRSLPFDSQVKKISFATQRVTAQYSIYHLTAERSESYFVSVAASFSIDNNRDALTKVTINEKTNVGTSPGDRAITKTYDAYQGDIGRASALLPERPTVIGSFSRGIPERFTSTQDLRPSNTSNRSLR